MNQGVRAAPRPEPVLVAVAHGSADPRASDTIGKLMATVAERTPGLDVRAAYLGHALPSLSQVMTAIDPDRPVTVVPLLLTAAHHSRADIPRILARFPRRQVRYGAPLGPHPLLLPVLERRLAEADPAAGTDPARTAVVLAAAGSSDPDANASIASVAAQWQAGAGWFAVRPAYASVASPDPGAAVTGLLRDGARRVAVATYLLAPGYFADRIRDTSLAAGASAVSAPLGASAEVAEVLLDRFREARMDHRAAAAAMPEAKISLDDPRAIDVRALVGRHLEFARSHKPPGDVDALDVAGLLDPAVTFFSCREDGVLLAVGALKRLDRRHAELKSMHTAEAARGRGIGRAMVAHIVGIARHRGFRRISLKTGSQSAFTPARLLYASAGFTACGSFGDYRPSRTSTFMTLSLECPDSAA